MLDVALKVGRSGWTSCVGGLVVGVLWLGVVGCAGSGARVSPGSAASADGSLVIQLEPADLRVSFEDGGSGLPRSMQRRWAGTDLSALGSGSDTEFGLDTGSRSVALRLSTPRGFKGADGDVAREGTVSLGSEALRRDAAGSLPITVLRRPAVTVTLVRRPSGSEGAGPLESGLARITFDGEFLEAVSGLDASARSADALWLALRGLDAADVQRFQHARAPLDLPDAVRLTNAGIDAAGLRSMERRGTVFLVDEWLALASAGLGTSEVLAMTESGTAAEVSALIDARRAAEQSELLAALEAQEAEKLAKREALEAERAAMMREAAEAEARIALEGDDRGLLGMAGENDKLDTEGASAEASDDVSEDALLEDVEGDSDPASGLVEAAMADAGSDRDAARIDPASGVVAVSAVAAEDAAVGSDAPRASGDMVPTVAVDSAVPGRYVELLTKLGITRPGHVSALYQARVSPKMIHRFQRAGVRPSVIELIDAHRLQLDPDAAQTMTDAGYDVTIYDLALLDSAGVDPSYAAALFDDRFRPLTATQIVQLWEQRISVADVRQARQKALSTPLSGRP